VTLATLPFRNISKRPCLDCLENILVKFEVRSFNRFGAVIDGSSVHTRAQTHIERKHYQRYSLGSPGGDNNVGISSKASEEITSKSTENCRFRQPR